MGIKHQWNGTILTITSDSGTSSMDLKGDKGDTGARGVQGLQGKTGGGALVADGIISKDTTWSSAAIMDNFAEQMAVKGNPVECQPIPNYPLHIITTIEPTQSGSGEPYPAGAGKNLYNYETLKTTTIIKGNGVVENNGIKLTATADDCFTDFDTTAMKIPVTAGKTYTMTWEHSGGQGIVYMFGNSTTESMVNVTAQYGKLSYTAAAGITYITIRVGVTKSGETAVYKNIQVVEGTTATEYQPYSNIRPISGMDAVSVVRCGKNFVEKVLYGYITYNAIYNEDNSSVSIVARVVKGQTYTISCKTAFDRLRVAESKTIDIINGTPLTLYEQHDLNNVNEVSFTAGFTGIAVIYIKSTKDETIKDRIQMELGTATAFEPYNGNTFTMSLGETIYGGELDWNTGVLTVNKAMITLDGSTDENWSYNSTVFYTPIVRDTAYMIQSNYDTRNECSNYYKTATATQLNNMGNCEFAIGYRDFSSAPFIIVKDNRYKTLEAYLTTLNETPLQVCYELAEPYTIQLTEQEIKAISGTNTLYTDAAEISVLGRVDTMYQLSQLAARVAALEAAMIGG